MPLAPQPPCSQPGCMRWAEVGKRGRCGPHARGYRRRTHPRRNFYRTPEWRKLRRQVIDQQPWCATDGCLSAATDVAHVFSVKDHPAMALDRHNVRALCHSCHSRETANQVWWGGKHAGD